MNRIGLIGLLFSANLICHTTDRSAAAAEPADALWVEN